MTSLAELAFEMEFEEGAAAEPGAAPLMHSAWTESEALQARHSSKTLGGAPAEAASASQRQRSLEYVPCSDVWSSWCAARAAPRQNRVTETLASRQI